MYCTHGTGASNVCSEKRLCIFLDWLGSGAPYQSLARTYDVGKSTIVLVLHEAVTAFRVHMVPAEIKFPEGEEFTRVMLGFEGLCFLPMCVGALDGTFMRIVKPCGDGDAYWCYKKYPSIIVLALVNHEGRFIYVSSGSPGSIGDASTWNKSSLLRKLSSLMVMPEGSQPRVCDGLEITPFIVADAAFGLGVHVMKCYEVLKPTPEEFNFNYALIRTRRVVECAFGRLKGRFPIFFNSRLQNPEYASQVSLVACAMHNWCERHVGSSVDRAQWAEHVPSDLNAVRPPTTYGVAGEKRDALARHMKSVLNVVPVEYELRQFNTVLHGPVGFE